MKRLSPYPRATERDLTTGPHFTFYYHRHVEWTPPIAIAVTMWSLSKIRTVYNVFQRPQRFGY